MNQNIALESPWFGLENPRRGLNNIELANKFIKEHQYGSPLPVDDLDSWFAENIPGFVIPDKHGEKLLWRGHLLERHDALKRLNKSGSTNKVVKPFVVDHVGPGLYEVRRPQAAFAANTLARDVESLVKTKRRALKWLGQAIPANELSSDEIYAIRGLNRQIEAFERHTKVNVDVLAIEFDEVRHQLSQHFNKVTGPIPDEFKEVLFGLSDNDDFAD